MKPAEDAPGTGPSADPRARWEPPTLTPAGRVRDLVHGGATKVSGGGDADPSSARKQAGL